MVCIGGRALIYTCLPLAAFVINLKCVHTFCLEIVLNRCALRSVLCCSVCPRWNMHFFAQSPMSACRFLQHSVRTVEFVWTTFRALAYRVVASPASRANIVKQVRMVAESQVISF